MPDPYLLSNGVLRNKLGVTTAAELTLREEQLVTLRQSILGKKGISASFDFACLKRIHGFIFQDVYDWAGQARTCNLRKANYVGEPTSGSDFTPAALIEREADRIFSELAKRNELQGLEIAEFAEASAVLFAEINNLHTFREGNGRTQRMFIKALAANAGYDLAFDVVTRERMVAVSAEGAAGNLGGIRRLFNEILDPRRVAALRKALEFLKSSNSVPWNELYIATTVAGQQYKGKLVGIAGDDFMMRAGGASGDWIAIGAVEDVPDAAESGDAITVEAKKF